MKFSIHHSWHIILNLGTPATTSNVNNDNDTNGNNNNNNNSAANASNNFGIAL